MVNEEYGEQTRPGLMAWERKLAFMIARKFERTEPEELEAELNRTVLDLRARPPPALRNWKNYLAKALHNRADNWTRDRRAAAKRESALPDTEENTLPFFALEDTDPDLRLAFDQPWQELGPDLRDFWEQLVNAKGNQSRVARQLGKHRNTIRAWIGKIQQILVAHGFQPGFRASTAMGGKRRTQPNGFVVISSRLLQAIATVRLSGTQWRILLWVLRETSRRKQRTVPFRWYHIARQLTLDRSNVHRAGQGLLRARLISIESGRIGLQRESRRCRRIKE